MPLFGTLRRLLKKAVSALFAFPPTAAEVIFIFMNPSLVSPMAFLEEDGNTWRVISVSAPFAVTEDSMPARRYPILMATS